MHMATTATKTHLKETIKSNTVKNWVFDDSFYRDLEQATLLGEQIYPLEQALPKTRAFFNDLLADKGLQEQENYITVLKQMTGDDSFIQDFAEHLTLSMQLYHFEKQNMLVLKTQRFDELGKNVIWSFFTKEPFCYPLHLTHKNAKKEIYNLNTDYSFSLQEFDKSSKKPLKGGQNVRYLFLDNIPSLDNVWTVVSYLCQQHKITDITESVDTFTETHDFLCEAFDDLENSLDAYVHVYLNNFLPKILEFYGLVGDRSVFYTHAKSSIFHQSLNKALYLSNLFNNHQTQLISKYQKLIKFELIASRVFNDYTCETLKNTPDVFANDKTYLQYLLSDDDLQFEFTPRFIKFLSKFDPTDVYYAISLDKGLFCFLYNIQHLKAEQLPSGDTKDFCEQSRLLWLHWYLGCQYPANLGVTTLKFRNKGRYKGISERVGFDGIGKWYDLKRTLDVDERDYLTFCYQRLGLSDYLDDIPHELRVGTLKAFHDDTLYYHQFYTGIDTFLHHRNGVDNAPPLFDVMKFLGKFDNQSGIEIKQLLTQAEFSQESQRMKHCVSSYYPFCVSNGFAIFHLSGLGEQSTLQLGFAYGDCEIIQHRGVKNNDPCDSHLALADKLRVAFDEKIKRRGNLKRLGRGFEKHQQAIKEYYKANPIDDMSKPFNADEWERFLAEFGGFKLLPRLVQSFF